jgi:hypothetical protein
VIGYVPNDQLVECAKKKLSFVVYNVGSLKTISKLKGSVWAISSILL